MSRFARQMERRADRPRQKHQRRLQRKAIGRNVSVAVTRSDATIQVDGWLEEWSQ